MNSIALIAIGIMIGWYADKVLLTLRTIAFRLRNREPEGGVVENGVTQPVSSRTVGSAGHVIDPMTEEQMIAMTNKEVRRLNGRS